MAERAWPWPREQPGAHSSNWFHEQAGEADSWISPEFCRHDQPCRCGHGAEMKVNRPE
jgi:hypothetical protein